VLNPMLDGLYSSVFTDVIIHHLRSAALCLLEVSLCSLRDIIVFFWHILLPDSFSLPELSCHNHLIGLGDRNSGNTPMDTEVEL
jgi:hypothetical protein